MSEDFAYKQIEFAANLIHEVAQRADLRCKFVQSFRTFNTKRVIMPSARGYVGHVIVRPDIANAEMGAQFNGKSCTDVQYGPDECVRFNFGLRARDDAENTLIIEGCDADVMVVFVASPQYPWMWMLPSDRTMKWLSTCAPYPMLVLDHLVHGLFTLSNLCHHQVFEDMKVNRATTSVTIRINGTQITYTKKNLEMLDYVVPCLLAPIRIDSLAIVLGDVPDDFPACELSAKRCDVKFE